MRVSECRGLGWVLSCCWLWIACAGSAWSAEATLPSSRYNVLWIVADDLRTDLGCYGDAQAKTPHLDRLAARGVRFDRAYVQYTVCNPSRVSFLTSTRPEKNGVTGNAVFFRDRLPDIVTLPQLFRNHGAMAASYGKILHAGLVEGVFDPRFLDIGKSWDEARMFQPTEVGRRGEKRNLTGDKLAWCAVGDMEGGDEDQSDGQAAAQAIAAMERFRDRTWFIGAGFHRPHDPFVVSKSYVAQFPEGSLSLHRDPAGTRPVPRLAIPEGAFLEAFQRFTDQDRLDYLTHYYAGVTQTDAQVGRLMGALDRLKLWDRTVVVFVGDHGYHLGERGWWNKNTLFEHSCRAPLIIVAPGVRPGVTRSLVEFLDLYPTVADLCGLPIPSTVTGVSLRPVLEDGSRSVRDAAVTHVTRGATGGGFSVRTDRWRYTEWNEGRDGVELYDHASDPGEWRNLADDPQYAAVRSQMSAELKRLTR